MKTTSSSSSSSSFWGKENVAMRKRISQHYLIVPMIRRYHKLRIEKSRCAFEEQIDLTSSLGTHSNSDEIQKIVEQGVMMDFNNHTDDPKGNHLQILCTEPIGTGRPRLDLDKVIEVLLMKKRIDLLKYAILCDPEHIRDTVSILIKHAKIDTHIAKILLTFVSNISKTHQEYVLESLLNAKMFPEFVLDQSKNSMQYVNDHLIQLSWLWNHDTLSNIEFWFEIIMKTKNNDKIDTLRILCRVFSTKHVLASKYLKEFISFIEERFSAAEGIDGSTINLLWGILLVTCKTLSHIEGFIRVAQNMFTRDPAKGFALRVLLREEDLSKDLSSLLEIWTGLRSLDFELSTERRKVLKAFMQKICKSYELKPSEIMHDNINISTVRRMRATELLVLSCFSLA